MKKTYINPQMFVSEFELEGLIAMSLQMKDKNDKVNTQAGGDDGQLTNKYNSPWSATNWE